VPRICTVPRSGAVPELTIVIPLRDDPAIVRCVASVDSARARVLVVLNQPTDEIRRVVSGLDVDVVEAARAGGPGACEHGLQRAATDHVLFMDSDCVFRPGTVDQFVGAIGRAPFVKGRVVFGYRNRLERVVSTVRTIHTCGPSFVFKVPLMVDRSVLGELDGFLFDRRLPWTEDYHLTARIRRQGLDVHRLPGAIVIHQPISPRLDLRRAFQYGLGHAEGQRLGLEGYRHSPRLRLRGTYAGLRPRFGRGVAVYGVLWTGAFVAGYRKGRK
jgi:hypothetical protein